MEMSGRRFKDEVYEQFARIGKAVASPRRLELLDLLCEGPRTVDALATQTGQSLANTSHHLQILRSARLLESEKAGTHVTYRIAGDDVGALLQAVRGLAESRLAEIDQVTRSFLETREAMEPIDSAGLLARMREGSVTLLDVRPAEEYLAGHVPGAVSIPLGELERHVDELSPGDQIVAYCRGPYCVLAVEAVNLLRARGLNAVRMEDGVRDWRARGLEVETTEVAA
jgi:rhodanese-related sulfurtransferase/DNA-binding transcriptional ArsR family regulator